MPKPDPRKNPEPVNSPDTPDNWRSTDDYSVPKPVEVDEAANYHTNIGGRDYSVPKPVEVGRPEKTKPGFHHEWDEALTASEDKKTVGNPTSVHGYGLVKD